ncbi:MAG: D-alanyl-D-alanine carboxypeptidase/D-alanyl-D-alanine-endopeptidase, partial [Moorea sp. SIO3C2]|nr:D-alanyl-D-alanine carboxypeptidase/D-alanyl-D-alanine-endopeptidase [Moorena sp. SIO3C2]
MKQFTWAVALSAVATSLGISLPAVAYCRADLTRQLDTLTRQPSLQQAQVGVHIETQAGQIIYSRNADRYLVPASNVKLLTTAAALSTLGPDFTVRTAVYGQQRNGLAVVQVRGQGDPTFGDAQLVDLAQQLQRQGISTISNLLGNDSYFQGPLVHPNWEWEDIQAGYGAAANSLILNANELGFTLCPQAVGQPLRLEWE